MSLQLILSCDLDKSQSGPTLIHSTGVEHYKIPPEVIRILQENISNDLLSDHDEGVLCQDGPQHVLGILRRNGFTLLKQTTDTNKALWTLSQSGGSGSGGSDHHPPPHPTPSGENEGDANGENQEENNEEGEEEEPAEEEPEE